MMTLKYALHPAAFIFIINSAFANILKFEQKLSYH